MPSVAQALLTLARAWPYLKRSRGGICTTIGAVLICIFASEFDAALCGLS